MPSKAQVDIYVTHRASQIKRDFEMVVPGGPSEKAIAQVIEKLISQGELGIPGTVISIRNRSMPGGSVQYWFQVEGFDGTILLASDPYDTQQAATDAAILLTRSPVVVRTDGPQSPAPNPVDVSAKAPKIFGRQP